MSTIEDFENAPIGATATSRKGNIALKTGRRTFEWSIYDSLGNHCNTLSSDEMVDHEKGGFTLNHVAPNTAREALELVWELAHPVKEGHKGEPGTELIARFKDDDFRIYRALEPFDGDSVQRWAEVRALDPLPEPEPDWLDALAILASHPVCADTEQIGIWVPSNKKGYWEWPIQQGEFMAHWTELEEVTPLYPKDKKND